MFHGRPSTLFPQAAGTRRNLAPGGLMEIRGTVRGDIYHQGRLVVGVTGFCESNVVATFVEVAGEVHGSVQAEKLVIHSTGRVYGRANYKNLVMRDGGLLEQPTPEIPVAEAGEGLLPVPLLAEVHEETLGALPRVEAREGLPKARQEPPRESLMLRREDPPAAAPTSERKQEMPCLVRRQEPVFVTSF